MKRGENGDRINYVRLLVPLVTFMACAIAGAVAFALCILRIWGRL